MADTVANTYPLIAAQWSSKNNPLTPADVSPGSHKRVWWKGPCGHEWQAIVKNRVNGAGCPICSGNLLLSGVNDLATMKPELVSEWSDKNLPLTPDMVLPCTNKTVWWRCIHGNERPAKIADRYYGSGCPYCEGHRLYKGFNDLASNYPDLAVEWSDKNAPKLPDEVFPKSRENVWWKCRVCGYEWRSVINTRVKGSGCPVCDEKVIGKGINDLATTDPDILAEWDYERNYSISPERISRNSLRVVWWKCKRGHRWRAKISDRVLDHEPCHLCVRAFERLYPDMLLRYYLKQTGYTIVKDAASEVGVPLTHYISEKRAAIEISKPEYNDGAAYRREVAKTELCHRSKIRLIRITRKNDMEFEGCVNITRLDDSDESLTEAIFTALQVLRIKIDNPRMTNRERMFIKYMKK